MTEKKTTTEKEEGKRKKDGRVSPPSLNQRGPRKVPRLVQNMGG